MWKYTSDGSGKGQGPEYKLQSDIDKVHAYVEAFWNLSDGEQMAFVANRKDQHVQGRELFKNWFKVKSKTWSLNKERKTVVRELDINRLAAYFQGGVTDSVRQSLPSFLSREVTVTLSSGSCNGGRLRMGPACT